MTHESSAKPVFFNDNTAEFSEYETPAEKCVSGQPLQRTWSHFSSKDDKFFAGVWEAEPGRWTISYSENEFCQILSGRSVLHDRQGNAYPLKAGDNFVIPAGFEGEWEVQTTTRKIYAIYQA